MDKKSFILSLFLLISVSINILQILNFKYKYERIKNLYLKKEQKLLRKSVEQNEKIIELQNKMQMRKIK